MFTQLIKTLDRAGKAGNSTRPSPKKGNRTQIRKGFEAWSRKRRETAALPAAYATHVRSRFSATTRGDEVRVSGCDLVYNIPETVANNAAEVFAVIPANPAYWDGTRISQLAPAYMNYRPIRLSFHYIPQVAVTQAGTVYMGTIWNGAPVGDNLQQTLVTSNGGCLTQCYVPADTVIKLGGNLQQNLFTMNGSLDPDTSPFVFMAGVAGASVIPGYFYVEYEYAFKNPIGTSWVYEVNSPIPASGISVDSGVNQSILLLESTEGFGAGTIFDSETDGLYYHGSPVTLAGGVLVSVFSNRQAGSAVMRARATEHYLWDLSTWKHGGSESGWLAEFDPVTRKVTIRTVLTAAPEYADRYYRQSFPVSLPPSTVTKASNTIEITIADNVVWA